MIKIIIADCDPTFSLFCRGILKKQSSVIVVGEVKDKAGLSMCEKDASIVIISDKLLHDISEPEAFKFLPKLKLLLISQDNLALVNKAVRYGIKGFLNKHHIEDLGVAIVELYERGFYIDEKMAIKLAKHANRKNDSLNKLTKTEARIFYLLTRNYSEKQIAVILKRATTTVHRHHMTIHKKLGCHSLHDLKQFIGNNHHNLEA